MSTFIVITGQAVGRSKAGTGKTRGGHGMAQAGHRPRGHRHRPMGQVRVSTGHSKQGKSVRSGSPSTAELITGFTFTGLKEGREVSACPRTVRFFSFHGQGT